MEKPDWEIRRQVPEDDPEYLEEVQKLPPESRRAFKADIESYDHHVWCATRYSENLENYKLRLGQVDSDSPAAAKLMQWIEEQSQSIEDEWRKKGNGLRETFLDVFTVMGATLAFGPDGLKKRFYQTFLKNLFALTEIQDELKGILESDPVDLEKTFERLHVKVIQGRVSDEFLYTVAKQYSEYVEHQEIELQTLAKAIKEDFKNVIRLAVEREDLPPVVLQKLSRLDLIRVRIVDRLANLNTEVMASNNGGKLITVSNELLDPNGFTELRCILFHEFFHEISGKSINILKTTSKARDQMKGVLERKVGLSLVSEGGYRNVWLNEAITEWLTLKFSGHHKHSSGAYKGSEAYTLERRELDRLFDLGLTEDIVLEAYFEDITSDQPVKERAKYFAQLIQGIEELDGPFAMNQLETRYLFLDIQKDIEAHRASLYSTSVIHGEEQGFDLRVRTVAGKAASQTRIFSLTLPTLILRDSEITVSPEAQIIRLQREIKKKYPQVEVDFLHQAA